ncbi:MAG: EamA family transporter, partial [Verrucomicrobiota bacterium]
TVPEVLLFTVFTPLYVTLLYDLLRRRFVPVYLLTAGLAVAGTAVLRWNSLSEDYWLGFAVVQGANLCFALGQVGYKRVVETEVEMPPQHVVFGWFFVGALLVAVAAWAVLGEPRYPTTGAQWTLLVWLGVGASGLGYFLWNKGASRVNAGALAVMNNALVPAGLVVNVLIWNRAADLGRLALGAAILLGALLLNEAWRRRREPETAVEEG